MAEEFEAMLTGGHPNSLGRTIEVVDVVLEDRAELADLFACYFSEDEVVRLRVSSVMKRVTTEHPDWTIEFMQHNLAHHDDWIVLNNSMQVLHEWSRDDPALADWLSPHLERLSRDRRKSVAGRATKLLAETG